MNPFADNIIAGLKRAPDRTLAVLYIFACYGVTAFLIGSTGGIFSYGTLHSKISYILPFTLFIFPSLLEELFFRGILIPRKAFDQSKVKIALLILISSLLFVVWHPLNAFLFNHDAQRFFYDPWFLSIVFLLGITCGTTYVLSRSLWVPIIIHWLTVLNWVLFLGGRNLLKSLTG